MHILFVGGQFPQLTFIFRMVRALAERGNRLTVAARGRGDWEPFRLYLPMPSGFSVRYLLPEVDLSDLRRLSALMAGLPVEIARSPRKAIRLWKTCRERTRTRSGALRMFIRYLPFLSLPRPDIIQFAFLPTATLYPWLGELLDVPTVVSCRGSDLHMLEVQHPERRRSRLEVLRRVSAIHCVSAELAGEVARLTGRTENVWVNRPAVPVESIPPKEAYEARAEPVIITVGSLEWQKGHDYLLAALARLKREGVPFRAEIIGDGELYAKVRFSIEDLGLSPEVSLPGRLAPDEVLARLKAADLFVLSSHQEGISNAVLEAMAAGLPIVTTNAGGMAEAVRDGVDGYIVPVRDIPAMAERIRQLLQDAALRERMGRAARERCRAEFSLERQAAVFEEIYRATIEQYRSGAGR